MTGRAPAANGAGVFRRLILTHPRFAAALVACVLAMKLLVPAGFMPAMGPGQIMPGQIMVVMCTGMGQQRVAIDIPGLPAQQDDAAKSDRPCIFAGFGSAMLGGADPVQLAQALLSILALGVAGVAVSRTGHARHLWPPMRGPPPIS